MCEYMLQSAGYEVEEVTNGAEAVDRTAEAYFDVMIIDGGLGHVVASIGLYMYLYPLL